jgi:glucose/arabinose dehydrogenase
LLAQCAGLLAACGDMGNKDATAATSATATPAAEPDTTTGFATTELARFDSPWAMTFLPDGRLLVTEMGGTLKLFDPASGATGTVSGVPTVVHRGQGGFGDVVLHPRYADNQLVYISYVEAGEGGTGSAVARARLALDDAGGGALENLQVIWRQVPKMDGNGHFGQRIAFGPDGMLYISSSERQKFDPAQDMSMNLGKILRLNDDGTVPADNPFVAQGGVAAQVWTLGHRNVLGLAFDGNGQLWAHEMGPRGGDELNRIEKGANYGYPLVSEGNHYSGLPIPDHDTRPEFRAPVIAWTPVISPAGLVFYDGDLFPAWKGDAFVGGLSSQSLVRVEFDGNDAREAQRFDMGRRIREVEQGPDGALWVLGDGSDGPLLKLVPKTP